MDNKNKNLIDYALAYAEKFSVIPIGKNKKPLLEWKEYQTKKADEAQIRKWWNDNPNTNIGIITGAISGIIVVDIEKGGSIENLPPTVISKTGGGGWHFFYKYPGVPVKNAVRIKELMDIRGDAGYIIAPPSLHKSGKQYEWLVSPDDAEFADLPHWILEQSKENKEKADWQKLLTSEISEGERNQTATQVAGKLLYHLPNDLWEVAGWEMFIVWNDKHGKPPMAKNELRTTWESIKKAETERRAKASEIVLSSTGSKEKRTPISFDELEKVISKWLLIKDKGLIRVLMATVIANKLSADPVWLFLVAAPGGTKTELIRGLNKVDGIYSISDLTPQTFLSGDKGKNVSLLLRIPANTIFTYKDFTTVLTMHRDKQQAIISQLREIYDGAYRKEFGNGESRDWTGKIGFIAGVTSVIDRHYEIYAVLGERFIQYRPIQPDGIALAKRAISNSGGEKHMREEIQNAMADFVAGIKIPDIDAFVSEEIKDKIAHLAGLCVKARSGIIRDGSLSREIELIPDIELPTRLAKQLITLYSALSLIGGATPNENYELIFKIGLDNLPQKRRRALELLIAKNEQIDTSSIAESIGYPTNTTRRALEDLHGLGLIEREHGGQGRSDKWQVSGLTKELLEKAKPDINAPVVSGNNKSDTLPETSDDIVEEINKVFSDGEQATLPEMSS